MILLLLLIFAFGNSLFFIWFSQDIAGSRLQDVGLLLIIIGLFWGWFVKRTDISSYKNPFTWFIFFYLIFIFAQASFTTMYYGQALSDSLIAARHQMYYGIFFLFLMVLNTRENVNIFMSFMTILSLVIIGMTIINYYGIVLFHHKWAEGHGERAGITRAYVPAMEILVTVGIWHIVRYLEEDQYAKYSLICFLIIYAAVIFRQTRMYILALSITVIILLINKRRFKVLAGLTFCFFITGTIFTTINNSNENIIVNSIQSTYKDVSNEEGSWRSRMRFIRYNIESIKEHPYIGNGGLLIRKDKASTDLHAAAYGSDLGYIHVIKFLGIPGLIWMVALISVYYSILIKNLKKPNVDIVMAKFSGYLFTLILIAEITINFFMDPWRILILCLVMAILLNSANDEREAINDER